MKYVYLAGPDVFLENAKDVLQAKAEFLRQHGFNPLTPLDNESSDPGEIYDANISFIEKCDAVLANVCPLHGTEPDSGTIFEIGYAKHLNKVIITYSNPSIDSYKDRIEAYVNKYPNEGQHFLPEPFGLKQNLMISKSADSEVATFVDAVEELKILLK